MHRPDAPPMLQMLLQVYGWHGHVKILTCVRKNCGDMQCTTNEILIQFVKTFPIFPPRVKQDKETSFTNSLRLP